MKTNNQFSIALILLMLLPLNKISAARDTVAADSAGSLSPGETSLSQRNFKMTTLTFGGNGVSFTHVNNQPAVMTGGRGSATFNNRYTIGGGGWGMLKGVEVQNDVEGVYNFAKMGYGGMDFGYLIVSQEKINLGTKILLGGGAIFKETVPDSEDKDFRMFPVLEPTIYSQISLGKLFKFEIGASYRFITGTNLSYVSDRELSGFSCYIGFLIRAVNE